MNFPTIGDVKHIKADMTDMERHELILQSRRMLQIRELGDAYLLHPKNAPKRASYNPLTGALLAM